VVLFVTQPGLRSSAEQHVFGWLLDRQLPDTGWALDPQALERVTATDPTVLPQDQARLADWLSRKYRVAKEPISALVAEAFAVGQQTRVDPMLILSVMAMESRFNPFAASPVGAQGLMQVMTRVHSDKFESFGGDLAAFDPVSNLRVGALVLKETIRRAGSVEGGLRLYVGAVTSDGSDYINKVLSEHDRLKRVAEGQRVAFNAFQRQAPAIEADPPVHCGRHRAGSRSPPNPRSSPFAGLLIKFWLRATGDRFGRQTHLTDVGAPRGSAQMLPCKWQRL
jgi:hypothetical protein